MSSFMCVADWADVERRRFCSPVFPAIVILNCWLHTCLGCHRKHKYAEHKQCALTLLRLNWLAVRQSEWQAVGLCTKRECGEKVVIFLRLFWPMLCETRSRIICLRWSMCLMSDADDKNHARPFGRVPCIWAMLWWLLFGVTEIARKCERRGSVFHYATEDTHTRCWHWI